MSTLGFKDPAMLKAAAALAESFKSGKATKGKASKKKQVTAAQPPQHGNSTPWKPSNDKVTGRSMKDAKWEVRTALPTVLGTQGLDFLHRSDLPPSASMDKDEPSASQSCTSTSKSPICEPPADLLMFESSKSASNVFGTSSTGRSRSLPSVDEPTTPSESSVSNILDTFNLLMTSHKISDEQKSHVSRAASILDSNDSRDIYDEVVALADVPSLDNWPVLVPNACSCAAKTARKGLASSAYADENASTAKSLGRFTALDESLMHEAPCPLGRSSVKDLVGAQGKVSSLGRSSSKLRPEASEFVPGK